MLPPARRSKKFCCGTSTVIIATHGDVDDAGGRDRMRAALAQPAANCSCKGVVQVWRAHRCAIVLQLLLSVGRAQPPTQAQGLRVRLN